MRLLVSAWLLACGLVAQAVELPAEVRFGEAFEVVVDARGAFDPAQLAPLEVEVLSRVGTAGGERLRLRARCYVPGQVELALDPPRTLTVQSVLVDQPVALEWPSDGYALAEEPASPWLLAGLSALGALAAFAAWRRVAARAAPAAPAQAAPAWSAAAALRALDGGEDDLDAFFLELKAIVRRHCAERFGLPAEVRTSEELLRALPRAREPLRPCLTLCDVALFSRLPDRHAETERSRAHALRFVEATEAES